VSQPDSDDDKAIDRKQVATMAPAAGAGAGSVQAPARAASIRRAIGAKELITIVPYSFALACTAGGIINTVQQILADANTAEWNSLLGLYDEYMVESGEVKYSLVYATPTQIPSTASPTNDYNHVLTFDPVDQTPLTSVREGTESPVHKLTMPTYRPIGTVALPGWMGTHQGMHRLKWTASRFKAVNVQVPGGTVAYMPGQWLSMGAAGSNTPVGALKSYGVCSHAAVINCVVGVHYLKVHFRARK